MTILYTLKPRESLEDDQEIRSVNDVDIISNYISDESRIIIGYADKVLYPHTEKHISKIIYEASKNKIRVTISGGGTGITGSRVPLGGIVIATDYMTKIDMNSKLDILKYRESGREYMIGIGYDDERREYYAVAPPGIPLRILNYMVEMKNLYYPPNPTEKNAYLGGTIATNASGSRGFYYGSTRDYIRRLRIVLTNGEILDIPRGEYYADGYKFKLRYLDGEDIEVHLPRYKMPNVRKNVAGYYSKPNMDIIDLFIGSEGTLGVFTEIEIKLIKKPEIILPIYIYFKNYHNSIEFVKEIRSDPHKEVSGSKILSIEYFDKNSAKFLRSKYSGYIPEDTGSIIFIELESDNEDRLMDSLSYLDKILDDYETIKISTSLDRSWFDKAIEIRHALPESVNEYVRRHGTHKVATDVAVPDDKLDEIMEYYNYIGIESGLDYVIYGHIGDNNLHFNFLPRNKNELDIAVKLTTKILIRGVELGGTVTAEHGVGKKKVIINSEAKPLIELMYGYSGLIEMARLKNIFDPNHILNIGNIIPYDILEKIE